MKAKTLFFVDQNNNHLSQIIAVTITSNHGCDPKNLIEQLRQAITEWTEATEEGQSALTYAGEDLNIGDIAGYENDPSFVRHLNERGMKLEIEYHGESSDIIPFGTPLVSLA